MEKKLELGTIVCTPGIQSLVAGSAMKHESPSFGEELSALLKRHEAGDWGDLCEEDKQANDEDAAAGCGALSMYITSNGEVYIKTDVYPEGPATTILLPEEY